MEGKKFIFVITPEIRKYLEWKSQRTNKHKSKIVRNSILGSSGFVEFINHCEDTREFIDNYQKPGIL